MATPVQQIETPAGTFRVVDYGDKNAAGTIIFCNSIGSTIDIWQHQAQALSDEFRTICYDQRGFGHTISHENPASPKEFGDDIVCLMDALGISEAVVCGQSLGGLIALQLTLSHPDRVDAIIISNMATKFIDADFWEARKEKVSEGQQTSMQKLAEHTADVVFTEEYRQQNPKEVQRLVDYFAQTDPDSYAACCEVLAHTNLAKDIGKIEVPALIIAGTEDKITTIKDALEIHEKIKKSTVIQLKAAHLSNIEAADEFTKAVRRYVGRFYEK